MAIIDGIQNNIDPGEPSNKEIYDVTTEDLQNVP